jgi:hypothetical protein
MLWAGQKPRMWSIHGQEADLPQSLRYLVPRVVRFHHVSDRVELLRGGKCFGYRALTSSLEVIQIPTREIRVESVQQNPGEFLGRSSRAREECVCYRRLSHELSKASSHVKVKMASASGQSQASFNALLHKFLPKEGARRMRH